MQIATIVITLLAGLTVLNVAIFHGIYAVAGSSKKRKLAPDLPVVRVRVPYANFWVLSLLLASTDVMAVSLIIQK